METEGGTPRKTEQFETEMTTKIVFLLAHESNQSWGSFYFIFVCSSIIYNCPKLKQSKRLSTDVWINKLGDLHTMEYYSVIERNKLLMCTTTWISLKSIYDE